MMAWRKIMGGAVQLPDFISRDTDSATNTASTTMTFTGLNLGPTDSQRWIVVIVGSTDIKANLNTMTDISLAGSSASTESYLVNDSEEGNAVDTMLGVAFFNDTTNTTGNVVVTFNTTLSTSGSTYVHVFSLSQVPTSWTATNGSSDDNPGFGGALVISTGSSASTVALLAIGIWEGASGSGSFARADIVHANANIGDATNGFLIYIGQELKPISASSVQIGTDSYSNGDSGCGRWIGFNRT